MKKSLLKFGVWTIIFIATYGLSKYFIFESLPKAEGFGNYAIVMGVMLLFLIPMLVSLWHLVILIGKAFRIIDINA